MKSYYRVFIQIPAFLLLVFCCLLPTTIGVTMNLAGLFTADSVAMLHVEGMCCECSAEPAIRELLEVPGVKAAKANFENKLIHLELAESQSPAPKLIWEAVETTSLKPTTLCIAGRRFRERPSK